MPPPPDVEDLCDVVPTEPEFQTVGIRRAGTVNPLGCICDRWCSGGGSAASVPCHGFRWQCGEKRLKHYRDCRRGSAEVIDDVPGRPSAPAALRPRAHRLGWRHDQARVFAFALLLLRKHLTKLRAHEGLEERDALRIGAIADARGG